MTRLRSTTAWLALTAMTGTPTTGQPVSAPPIAALPLATARPTTAPPPAPVSLPPARTIRVASRPRAERYRYADHAAAMGQAFANTPPDYTVDYQGTRPWVWRANNGPYRVVERLPQGERDYYYQAGADARAASKVIGATAHYVTADLDEGPIIEQDVERISHADTADDLIRKGRDIERRVLSRAVGLDLGGRVLPNGARTVVFRD